MAKKTTKGTEDPIFTDEVIEGLALAVIKGYQKYLKEEAEKKAEKKKVDDNKKNG